MAPSHYLIQCWLIIRKVQCHRRVILYEITQPSFAEISLKIFFLMSSNLPGPNELTQSQNYLAAIFHTFSNAAFSLQNRFFYYLNFTSVLQRVKLIMSQQWFMKWLGAAMVPSDWCHQIKTVFVMKQGPELQKSYNDLMTDRVLQKESQQWPPGSHSKEAIALFALP